MKMTPTKLKSLRKQELIEYTVQVENKLEEKILSEKEIIGKFIASFVFGAIFMALIR